MHNNMSSVPTCNQLTQNPLVHPANKLNEINSNQFFIQCHQTTIKLYLSMQREPVSDICFNTRQWTKSRKSVFLSVIYHSLNPVLLIPIYSTTILSAIFLHQNICICWVLMLDMSSLIQYTIFLFFTLTILNERYKLGSQDSCNFVQSVYHKLLRA